MEYWGKNRQFPFSKIETGKGETKKLIGWGVGCGLHHNSVASGLATDTPCKKAFTIAAGITEDEARLRLKRWLVAGHTTKLEVGKERYCHIKLGGQRLCHLGSHTEWGEFGHADLDCIIEGL